MLPAQAAGPAGREQQVSDAINALLLATLQRAGAPLASDDLLDQAYGLALNERWAPEAIAKLSRKAVVARVKGMITAGHVRVAGQQRDADARRETPLYEPSAGWDPAAPVPAPDSAPTRPGTDKSIYEGMSPRQRLAAFEAQSVCLESVARLIQQLQVGLADMLQANEKAKRILLAEGLEPR